MAETEGERLRRRGDEIKTRADFDGWLHLMILWLEDEAERERARGLDRSASRRTGQALLAREVHQRLALAAQTPTRLIETDDELDALPVRVVLRDKVGIVYERTRDDCGTWTGAYSRVGADSPGVPQLPARVLDFPASDHL